MTEAILLWSRTELGSEFNLSADDTLVHPDSWGRYQISSDGNNVIIDSLFRDCSADIKPQFHKTKLFAVINLSPR